MPEPILHIVLYQPEIPFNAGNVGRTCVAIGAKLWLVRPLGFLVDDRHVRRAGRIIGSISNGRWSTIGPVFFPGRLAEPTGSDQAGPAALHRGPDSARRRVGFGSESKGLPEAMRLEHPEQCLRIPMHGKVRSLNLSVAAALVAYEAIRQWCAAGQVPEGLEGIF